MTQLNLFQYDPADKPYPLMVADKWNFELAHYIPDGATPRDYLYHAVQWTLGLGAKQHTTWENIKNQYVNSNDKLKIETIPYLAADGKTYDVEFIDQQTCYHVAMAMRVTKTRPQLAEIKEYLARAGVFADEARRNPEQVIEVLKPLAQAKRERQIALHEQWGLDATQAAQRLKLRHEATLERNRLISEFVRLCDSPNIARLTNAEYIALFGATASTLKEMLNTKSIRDALDDYQLDAVAFAEKSLAKILTAWERGSVVEIEGVIQTIMQPIGAAMRVVYNALGLDHITGQPLLSD